MTTNLADRLQTISTQCLQILRDRGIVVLPDIYTNGGGVTVSFCRWRLSFCMAPVSGCIMRPAKHMAACMPAVVYVTLSCNWLRDVSSPAHGSGMCVCIKGLERSVRPSRVPIFVPCALESPEYQYSGEQCSSHTVQALGAITDTLTKKLGHS